MPIRRRAIWSVRISLDSSMYVYAHFYGLAMQFTDLFQSYKKLNGVFEVRIYPAEYSVQNILSVARDPLSDQAWNSRVVNGVDLSKLESIVDQIDYADVRRRKALYSRLYHEAIISHEQGRGISFTDMLTLLAHHKLINDSEALVYVCSIL